MYSLSATAIPADLSPIRSIIGDRVTGSTSPILTVDGECPDLDFLEGIGVLRDYVVVNEFGGGEGDGVTLVLECMLSSVYICICAPPTHAPHPSSLSLPPHV
jgi:hypothetical protein